MSAGSSESEDRQDSQPAAPPIGASVKLITPLPYLKSADPMPMLRPPDLIDPGEVGVVVECRPLGMVAVRFRRGTFLLAAEALSAQSVPDSD